MFTYFKKRRTFLRDLWASTPEIHSHVLPGLDDGSKNIQNSLELLKRYEEMGCPLVIGTPHTMYGIYDNTLETIKNSYQSIPLDILNIQLTYSSEYMLDDGFITILKEKKIIPLYEKYVLIEMSYFQPPNNLFDLIFQIGAQGYIPIMAHPERYAYFHQNLDIFNDLKNKGCLLQLNALSLSGHYGEQTMRACNNLLQKNAYDFIGIDTHKMTHLDKFSDIKVTKTLLPPLEKIIENTKYSFSD